MLQNLQKYQPMCVSVLLLCVLAPWFTQENNQLAQLDFWVIWFIAMLVLALPLLFLEVALAKRSKKLPLLGMEDLTRQADAKTTWRSASWLAIATITFISGGLIVNNVVQRLSEIVSISSQASTNHMIWLAIAIIALVAVTFIVKRMVALVAAVAIAAVVVSGFDTSALQVTSVQAVDWKNAVLLAVTTTGLGTGLYWQQATMTANEPNTTKQQVMSVWVAQLIAGLVFFMFQGIQGQLASVLYAVVSLFTAAWLISMCYENVGTYVSTNSNKKQLLAVPAVFIVGAIACWHGVSHSLNSVTAMYMLVALLSMASVFVYSIFAGWHMKISHLRKAINFGSEATYNVWRVAVRIVIPLALLSVILISVANIL